MQTQSDFQQFLDSLVADLEKKQANLKAGSTDPDWDLYYANTEDEAKAASLTSIVRWAVRGAIL